MDATGGRPALPPGWVWTTVGEIHLDKSRSLDPGKASEQAFELYSVPSFASGTPEIVPGKEIGSSKRTVEPRTVLLCRINPRINRVWIVGDYSPWPKIASTEWLPFFEQEGIYPEYLRYYLSSSHVRDFLSLHASGVGGSLMRVKASTVAGYPFPLPPLPEQRRIVARIEELFSQLDAGVAALERVRALLKRYRQAVLAAAVRGDLTREWRGAHKGEIGPAAVLLERIRAERRARGLKEVPPVDEAGLPELPEGWVWATVEELGTAGEQTVLTGPFGTDLGKEDFVESGVPLLTIGCLTDRGVSLERALSVTEEKALELSRYRLRAGDFLFSRMATVGRAGFIDESLEGALFNYHIMRLRLDPRVLLPEYFLAYIRASSQVREYVREVNHGATRDGINSRQLLSLPVCVPPMDEQLRIAEALESYLSVAEMLEDSLGESTNRAYRLRQAILQRAFEGKLVPQDPRDEPASVLLKRIREEQEVKEGVAERRWTEKRLGQLRLL